MMWELLVIVIVALFVFGPNELPHLAQLLGRAIALCQKLTHDTQATLKKTLDETALLEREKHAREIDQQYSRSEDGKNRSIE